ncbi:hypothetical protein [Cohnella herbarum]|nr:hypothetical protein [Cohnella herbarum]
MLTHSQDFNDLDVRWVDRGVGLTAVDDTFGYAGTEVALYRTSH